MRAFPQKLVKEFNRRVASTAERFVYYHKQEPWIRDLALKGQPRLNRIRWQ